MNWLKRVMMGRNGADQLNLAILLVGMVLILIGSFFRSTVINFLVLILVLISVFRMFSKNIQARSRENAVFLRIWHRLKNFLYREKLRLQNKKTYKFFGCPGCKKTLRVPKGKGRIYITCPKCGERFESKT
ncbi:MAG: hypothetical protein GX254_08855 [Clostridiales bacterium]|jgi:hypothetical protein|nr:hypothetical protein [Clostridiales bacterium]